MPRITARFVTNVRILMYFVLVLSAGAVFWFDERLWTAASMRTVPIWMALLPVCTFTLFVGVYSLDRFLLVRKRRYPLARAFIQIMFAVVFLSFLWPHQISQMKAVKRNTLSQDYVLRLIDHKNPYVRAAICELLGLRGQQNALPKITEKAHSDKSALVQKSCREALGHLDPRD